MVMELRVSATTVAGTFPSMMPQNTHPLIAPPTQSLASQGQPPLEPSRVGIFPQCPVLKPVEDGVHLVNPKPGGQVVVEDIARLGHPEVGKVGVFEVALDGMAQIDQGVVTPDLPLLALQLLLPGSQQSLQIPLVLGEELDRRLHP